MKYSLSKTLDRARKTVEIYARPNAADETSLKQNEDSAVEREEIQLALQELRHLLLESKTFEITASADFLPSSQR